MPDASHDMIVDLLRSCWVVERARSALYRRWTLTDRRFQASAERAEARAEMLQRTLERHEVPTDAGLVQDHRRWIENLVGSTPTEVPLGELFVVRLADWIDAHASPFLNDDAARLRELSDAEKSAVAFPQRMPSAPPFEPLEVPELPAPGEVLFRFGILADMHIGSETGERMVRAAIDDLNAAGVDLVIQLGDITDHGDRTEFETASKILDGLDAPVTTMLGNHDVFSMHEERLAGREYYPISFGREPDGVVLHHEGFTFAVLDSAEHDTSPFPPYDLVAGSFVDGRRGAVVRGALTPPQHDILADIAAPGAGPAFVFLHHPPQPFTGFPPIIFGLRDEDTGRLHATCDSGNVWGVFAGHTHRNAITRWFDGVPALEVAIPRDYPFGFGLVDVTAAGYRYRFVQLSDQRVLEEAYRHAGMIHRRYGAGPLEARALTWTNA